MIRISFSGIDGTGKSTQISRLENYLRENGSSFSTFHLFSKKQTVLSKIHESSLGKRFLLFIRGLGNGPFPIFIKFSIRLANVVVDSIATTLRNNILEKDIIIYDRYFYDVLICISYDFPKWKWLVFTVAKLIPRPEVIIIFDAKQEVVISRKPEHTITSATSYRKLYQDLASNLGTSIIDTNCSIELVFTEVFKRSKGAFPNNVPL